MRRVIIAKSKRSILHTLRIVGATLLGCGACLACGGVADAQLEQGAPSPEIDAADDLLPLATGAVATTQQPTALTPEDASALCGATPRGARKPASENEFRTMLVGSWLLCGSQSVFGTDEAGLAIEANGRWAKLTRAEDALIPLSGWNNEGSWESIDTSAANGPGVYQLNLNVDGSGTVITTPIFASEPALMRLDNHGVFRGDYVRMQ